jgi:site-specific recombinase XerD
VHVPRSAVTTQSVNDIKALQRDFERSQRAARRSPRTIETYREAIDQLAAFLERAGIPTAVAAIQRQHVEAFMNELHARTKPATASNRFRALQQFFKFAVEEEEIDRSPMERMHRPAVPVEPVPVLSNEDLRALWPPAPSRAPRLTSATTGSPRGSPQFGDQGRWVGVLLSADRHPTAGSRQAACPIR